jgi:hypothetical protein
MTPEDSSGSDGPQALGYPHLGGARIDQQAAGTRRGGVNPPTQGGRAGTNGRAAVVDLMNHLS